MQATFLPSTCNLSEILFSLNRQNVPAVWEGLLNLQRNGTLVIDYKEKNVKNVKNLIFYITAPDLSKVKIDGVGNFDAKEKLNLKNIAFELDGVGNCNVKNLHCDELKLDVDGVGNMKMNVDCGLIKAKVDGVGNITLSGKADTAFFKKDGVGKINHKNLKCKDITKKGWNF